jgi:hypothetical protein
MNERRTLFVLCCLTLGLLGCGDSPRVMLRDTITTWNELADMMSTIPGDNPEAAEAAAEAIVKGPLARLKKRWEGISKRLEKFSKLDKEGKKDLDEAVKDLAEDAKHTIIRLAGEMGGKVTWSKGKTEELEGRLQGMLKQFRKANPGADLTNLEKCVAALNDYKLELPDAPDAGGMPKGMPNMPDIPKGFEMPDMPKQDKKKKEEPSNLAVYADWWRFPRGDKFGMMRGMPGGMPGGMPEGMKPPDGFPGGKQ